MSGILFLKTRQLEVLREFYTEQIHCDIWLEQKDCVIFKHGNFLFGFCLRDYVESQAMLTFFFRHKETVDAMYAELKPMAIGEPRYNDKYRIYQFFARDPESRMVEIQWFDHPVAEYADGADLLKHRRSIREFLDTELDEFTVRKIVGLSRWAPSAYNRQPCYFIPIRTQAVKSWLGARLEAASAPISQAPMAMAVVADTDISNHPEQDGSIAASWFMLAAWHYGLGTCWIGSMNRDDIKQKLGIPTHHYLVTVTPLGYPARHPIEPTERRDAKAILRDAL
jgi:nitroreductase